MRLAHLRATRFTPSAGVVTGPTDSIWKAQQTGPRCIVLGDSFTDGTGAAGGASTNWVRRFASMMGWGDTWARGLGGTGYLNPGTGGRVKFRDRVQADVIAYNPDVVVVEGGINDAGTYTAAAIGAEALALFQQIRSGLPNALLVVLSPMWRNGVETFPSYLLPVRDAIKAAAVQVSGSVFLDVLEMPLDSAYSTTLAAGSAVNATTISTAATPTVRTTIEIGTGTANVERRVVTAVSGGGPYSVTVAALGNTHASGDTVTLVGPALWTGTGRSGATTGAGNSDLLVGGSDGTDPTHPTQAGHDMIGSLVARLLAAQLPA
jgi:lysophospholipase L1-like esterase